jgi:hypothetical protein
MAKGHVPAMRIKEDRMPEMLIEVNREKVRIQIAGSIISGLPITTASLLSKIAQRYTLAEDFKDEYSKLQTCTPMIEFHLRTST